MTRRRWIADTWTPTTASLTGDQAAHLARVLRAEPGQIYDVVSNGFLHRAEILTVSEKEVLFTLHEELQSDAALPLHLLLAVFKFDHMEWAIEKATELGIAKITPILARRTEKHLAQSALKRSERWRRIALEASKQSRRTDIPEIADPTPLKSALESEKSPTRILLSETEQTQTLTAALEGASPATKDRVPHPSQSHREGWEVDRQTALAIGPEGGWTPEEMSLFTTHQWQPVTLGPRILRAETAAIAAIAIAATHLA
ncbi:RsmE family RNA methyltransferase [Tunturiibacter empetritectus]|uniref:Ribosomal RNA small subunit methyltransferase E n=2 Tax=Tunturiibacter TaxID=3154218 RepID=A0A852VGS9_9BACT|nr:RsmE family RNA methyltransferase [Edaphobacter lichenicola]NYF90840.1 16S rRNA (uracil1498-N3)-methyltransferase [Edaphobacter lichenicola]